MIPNQEAEVPIAPVPQNGEVADVYCICKQHLDNEEMVGCDGENCKIEWYHVKCVGLKQPPPEEEPWYCPDCKPRKR